MDGKIDEFLGVACPSYSTFMEPLICVGRVNKKENMMLSDKKEATK